MVTPRTRREFLSAVGQGMLVAGVGASLASDLGVRIAWADEGGQPLRFGKLEPLVGLMQETPVERLLPALVDRMRQGTELDTLVAAAALANARTFGGEDYVGFHTMMALAPAFHMARELDAAQRALPVFKVLYRNTKRIGEHGGRASEVLRSVEPGEDSGGAALQAAVRGKDLQKAERTLAAAVGRSPDEGFNALLFAVQDRTEVHRIVLPYRAWDLLELIGPEHAETLLRQSVHYCVKNEDGPPSARGEDPRVVLPKLLDQYHLDDEGRAAGSVAPGDEWVERMSQTIFRGTPSEAADAVAAALADNIAPDEIGEAISLAANQLVLRDAGRDAKGESSGKPIGSVHGDSIGVHACDSANAWRNIARVANSRNRCASLILGAYQVALDRVQRGGDFLNWDPLPVERHLERLNSSDPQELLGQLDEAIRGNMQAQASALAHRYGELGHPHRAVFALLLGYATSEDGALHAEKYYRTVSDEFAATRPAFRWRQLTALARVTASEYGRPAEGISQARELLQLA